MFQRKKLSVILVVLVLMGSTLLGACSSEKKAEPSQSAAAPSESSTPQPSADKPKEKVTLDFWAHWGSTTRRPIIEKIVSDFNASQDHIFVKYSFQPFGEGWTKELAAIAAGNPPDVIIQDIFTVGQRAEKKQATNLSDFLGKDPAVKDRFFEQLWDTVLYNNEPYALPFNTDTRFLYYNKKAFAEVGLDPNTPPKTWAELETFAKKLDKKNGKKYERIGYHANNAGGWDLWLQNSDGKLLIDREGPHYNSDEKAEALNWVKSWDDRLGKKEMDTFKATFGSKQNDPFVSGKLAMTVNNGTYFAAIKDFMSPDDIGFAPIPEMKPGSGNWSYGGGFTLEIPYGAKHPEESWEFMKYMTDIAAQKYWGMYIFDNIANKEAANDPELAASPVYKFATENMKWTLISPVPNNAPDYKNIANPFIEKALLGQDDPKSALDKAQAGVENLMKNTK